MKQIIALQGGLHTGKTLSISLLYELMKSNGYILLKDKRISDSREFAVLFQKKGEKIGVATYGSTAERIRSVLNAYSDWGCDIMVCACYKAGVTRKVLENYSDAKRKYIAKTVATFKRNKLSANLSDAQKMLEEIEMCLMERDKMADL
jgi:hypothetical protein